MRLSLEYGIPPHEVRRRFTSKDVGQILAYWKIKEELLEQAEREARVARDAADWRSKA